MTTVMKIVLKNTLVLLFIGIVGCASTRQSLVTHPKPIVRYPAKIGYQIGTLLGFPVSIILYPITVIASGGEDCETQAWAPFAPVIYMRDITSTIVGGIPWVFFGWWGVSTVESTAHAIYKLPETEWELRNVVTEYYSGWCGVRAPSYETCFRGANNKKQCSNSKLHGSRILLYAFDSGDFVRSVDENLIAKRLQPVSEALQANSNDFSVVGFTYGVSFGFSGVEHFSSVDLGTTFSVVNMTKLDMPEPYALLERLPSSILIDENGVIIDVRLGHLQQGDLCELLNISTWRKSQREPPGNPSLFIKEYSRRKPFHYYIYAKPFSSGHRLQELDIDRTNVYSRLLLPERRILRKSNATLKLLINDVKAGQAVLDVDFE